MVSRSIPILALALAGCATMPGAGPGAAGTLATTTLAGPQGEARGTARLVMRDNAPAVELTANGLTPGLHGVHLHTTGRCEGPGFESAGGHWNPTNAQHGRLSPAGPHAGDLGNVTVAADGTARATLPLPVGEREMANLFDTDGSALMIHGGRDDLRTDPGGDSGDRVACGVLRRG